MIIRALPAMCARDRGLAELAGWYPSRSPFVFADGHVTVRHFHLDSQALSKIERGFALDLADVASMVADELVVGDVALALFAATSSHCCCASPRSTARVSGGASKRNFGAKA